MKKTKVAYIISEVYNSLLFEWTAQYLNKDKFELFFILLNSGNSDLEQNLKSWGYEVIRIKYSGKKDIIFSFLKVLKILIKYKFDIVHTHLFDASLIGLLAAKIAGVKRRIHTRHNGTIHHDYHPESVKYDKFINYLSTEIVAVSHNIKDILVHMENVEERKIRVIHHGFKFDYFENISEERLLSIRKKYNLLNIRGPVIGVISRYIEWKGVQYIIPALVEYYKEYPSSHFIFANAKGPYSIRIKKLLKNLPDSCYTEIEFERDIAALYKLFDIFIHVPVDNKSEAFGQVYIEAMAAGVACIVTLSGVACEFISDQNNALVVPYKNSEKIYDALIQLTKNELLKKKIISNARKDVIQLFSLESMIHKLEQLYEN